MKRGLYLKLACMGIGKNKRLYVPYIITCISMVMMYYIMVFLQDSKVLSLFSKTTTLITVFNLGSWVIGIFAAIFLFYTNSFLMKSRKKEFGLYNILGMNKFNISRVLLWEIVVEAVLALLLGLVFGIAFSKLAELVLMNILRGNVNYDLFVSKAGIHKTVILFIVIFALILLNAVRQLYFSSAVSLLKSDKEGEKPLKVNWLFALAGVAILAYAYYMALSIKEPLTALATFFTAVILVIVATYLLFISGSVALCKILQKRKDYYYKARNFVSISSMAYRMKRNGAGLASICILGTMVLVMISGSACLYFGAEDSLRARYPRDIVFNISFDGLENMRSENIDSLKNELESIPEKNGIEIENVLDYRYASITGLIMDNRLEINLEALQEFNVNTYDDVSQVFFIPLEDYNRLMGASYELADNEAMIYCYRIDYKFDTLIIEDSTFNIAGTLTEFFNNGESSMSIIPTIFLVLPNIEAGISELMNYSDSRGNFMMSLKWYYGFDTSLAADEEIELCDVMKKTVSAWSYNKTGGISGYYYDCLEKNREDFFASDGGIFFLGIVLSIVFITATVLIIYYKQVTEGYEDEARFEIMQKVGMTKRDIRRSINSQMLTVFFAPLIMAVTHLVFAFPVIYKLLMLFNLTNLKLLIIITVISILIFALFYAVVYRITSNVYYNIVSGIKE